MVLLTSSAISVAISGGVVCLFTLLLFLSGYVLQQQTVRSLQEALSAPVEVRFRVQPPLPPQFQRINDDLLGDEEDSNETSITVVELVENVIANNDAVQIAIGREGRSDTDGKDESELSPQELWHAHIDASSSERYADNTQLSVDTTPPMDDSFDGHFAYVLSLPTPSHICSALLFTKWHRQFSQLSSSQANIIYLYPSDWETSSHPIYKDTLSLLLHSEHKHAVLLHPVQISKVWTGVDVESQLLSELARNPWPYDRLMYLRTPGMLIDTTRLDNTITSTYVNPALLKSSWTRLRAPARRGAATTLRPEVLLFAQGRGLMIPVGNLQKTLTAKVKSQHINNHHDEFKDEFFAKEAAYVLFDEKELAHRKKEKLNHNGIFERFERERELVCEGTELLT